MKDMYGCKQCQSIWAIKHKDQPICPQCGATMITLKLTDEKWDDLNESERRSHIVKILAEDLAKSSKK
jgi:RNA polymerase subunit RPABC4/transcription elongation factor Spt4